MTLTDQTRAAIQKLVSTYPERRTALLPALKLAQIDRARRAGIEQLFTTNDETNLGMREVNKRLGYRPTPVEILVRGPLVT